MEDGMIEGDIMVMETTQIGEIMVMEEAEMVIVEIGEEILDKVLMGIKITDHLQGTSKNQTMILEEIDIELTPQTTII